MKLEKLIEECADALQEEAGKDYAYYEDDEPFNVTVSTNDGYIELFYGKNDVEVVVFHDYETVGHPRFGVRSVNLEKFLTDALRNCVDWTDIEEKWRDDNMDEFQRNGFDSEADFWRWKEGR